MYPLGKRLKKKGVVVKYLNMPLKRKMLGESVLLLKKMLEVEKSKKKQGENLVLIGHSMGGLVIRSVLLEKELREVVDRVVLIGTPNKGAKLADICKKYIPFLSSIYKPLRSLEKENFKNLNLYAGDDVEIGCIAGSEGKPLPFRRFLDKENDGMVEVKEVEMEDLKDFLILPLNHRNIHRRDKVVGYIMCFIKNGVFK